MFASNLTLNHFKASEKIQKYNNKHVALEMKDDLEEFINV